MSRGINWPYVHESKENDKAIINDMYLASFDFFAKGSQGSPGPGSSNPRPGIKFKVQLCKSKGETAQSCTMQVRM